MVRLTGHTQEYDVGIERGGRFYPLYRKIAMPTRIFIAVVATAGFVGFMLGGFVMLGIGLWHDYGWMRFWE